MSDNLTKYGDISPRTAGYATKQLMRDNPYLLITERYADSKPLPKRHGKTIKVRCYENFDPPTAPLMEGVPPDGHKPTYRDVVATLQQEGDFVEITDVIQDTHEDPVLREMTHHNSVQAKETKEVRNIAVIKGGTNVAYAGNVASRSLVASTISRGQLRKIVRLLKRNKAEFFAKTLKAGHLYATEPVGPSFFALAHTDCESDIRNLGGFVPIEKYPDSDKAHPGEIGKCENIRFVLTPLMEPFADSGAAVGSDGFISTSDSNNDVYPVLIMAPHAWATVPLKGKNGAEVKVRNPGKPEKGDELGQSGSVGWKLWHTAMIQNDNYLYRYEIACTENPD